MDTIQTENDRRAKRRQMLTALIFGGLAVAVVQNAAAAGFIPALYVFRGILWFISMGMLAAGVVMIYRNRGKIRPVEQEMTVGTEANQ